MSHSIVKFKIVLHLQDNLSSHSLPEIILESGMFRSKIG